tara:strand:- start:709 stop:855 length:147 start_codon:yes stop_codon:yes gene_type:complete
MIINGRDYFVEALKTLVHSVDSCKDTRKLNAAWAEELIQIYETRRNEK